MSDDFAVSASEHIVRLLGVFDDTRGIAPAPVTPMDHARYWIKNHGLYVFPAMRGLGRPHIKTWSTVYNYASKNEQQVIAWWSEFPDADVGAFPSKSDHFVIGAVADEGGLENLEELEDDHGEFQTVFPRYADHWGNVFLWCKGRAVTSHNKVAKGVHIIGAGLPVYLPNSATPHLDYEVGGE